MRDRRLCVRPVVVAGMAALLALYVQAGSAEDAGEVWAPAQDTGQVFIVQGMGSDETLTDTAIQNPHLINFSPSGEYAYVSDVGNGKLNVVRADDRQVIASLTFGSGGSDTHQAKPSPDGSLLFVARRGSARTLHKVIADEASETWTVTAQQIAFEAPQTPICTVFRADGERAYVSLAPSDIAIVDVPAMTVLGTLSTNGAVACGMSESRDGSTIFVTSNGGTGSTTGSFYRLDTSTDTLTLDRTITASDLHFLDLSPNGKVGYASARGSEALKLIDLTGTGVGTVTLDPTPGPLNDQPDGVAVKGDNVYVALKNSGKLAVVKGNQGTVKYLDLVGPSSNALPHVTVRP